MVTSRSSSLYIYKRTSQLGQLLQRAGNASTLFIPSLGAGMLGNGDNHPYSLTSVEIGFISRSILFSSGRGIKEKIGSTLGRQMSHRGSSCLP